MCRWRPLKIVVSLWEIRPNWSFTEKRKCQLVWGRYSRHTALLVWNRCDAKTFKERQRAKEEKLKPQLTFVTNLCNCDFRHYITFGSFSLIFNAICFWNFFIIFFIKLRGWRITLIHFSCSCPWFIFSRGVVTWCVFSVVNALFDVPSSARILINNKDKSFSQWSQFYSVFYETNSEYLWLTNKRLRMWRASIFSQIFCLL